MMRILLNYMIPIRKVKIWEKMNGMAKKLTLILHAGWLLMRLLWLLWTEILSIVDAWSSTVDAPVVCHR